MIEIQGLTKAYGQHKAVDSLSFTAENGQITGFVGPNGAGKSTTMRCIIGLDTPTQGTAKIDGKTFQELESPVNSVGAMLDPGWLHPGRSAVGHLRWICHTAGLPRRRATEVLDLVGLTSVAKDRVGGFSLGMRQRLGIAVALLGDPANLVLDEPLNGLDPEGVRWARQLVQHYASQGRTVLVSSHLLSELALVADSVVLLGKGKLIRHDSVADLLASSAGGQVTVRVADSADRLVALAAERGWAVTQRDGVKGVTLSADELSADVVGKACFEAGLTVLELNVATPTLEDAVLDLTREHVEYATTKGTS